MKNLTKISLFLFVGLFSALSYSQVCQAGFTYTAGTLPGQIVITDNSVTSSFNHSNFIGYEIGVYSNPMPNYTQGSIYTQGGSQNIQFSYNGTYYLNYQLYGVGCSSSFIDTIVINTLPINIPCNAGLAITPGPTSNSIVFTDNSIGEDLGYLDLNYNGIFILTQSNPSATVQFPSNGPFHYVYHISDTNTGCFDSLSTIVSVGSYPCSAVANIFQQGAAGSTLYQNQSTLSHINTLITPGGVPSTQSKGPSQNFIVNYSSNGTYPYTLIIYDSITGCSDTLNSTIIITNFPCLTVQAGLTVTPGSNPGQFTITDNSSGGANFSYFDNGFGPSTLLLPNTSATVSYPSNGIYSYSYIVTDTNSNCYDTLVGTLTVSGMNQGCNANFILLQDSLNPSQYYCWNTSTGSSPAAALTYLWDFGDGNTSNLAYPTHTYNSLGIFTLCLTITETGANCTSTYCDTIIVSVKASGTTLNVLPAGTNLGVEEQNLINSLILYPNPSKGKFTIELEATNSSAVDISIVNLAGQTLYKEARTISSGINKISITDNDLADGTYLVSISNRNSGETKTLRLVKN